MRHQAPTPPRRTGLSRRRFLWQCGLLVGGATLTGAGAATYATRVEPRWVDIEPVRPRLPRLAAPFDGYRLVQLSDIHLGDWMNGARLAEVVRLVNGQRPDLIAITGDLVTDRPAAVAADLAGALRALRARDGVVAVLGNHDHWSDPALLRQVLRDGGARELANTAVSLERGGAALHIAGVDDVWEGQDRLDRVLAALPPTGAAVLLAHEPDFADTSAASGRFDLQLSGHSHGGQVVAPLLGPLVLPRLARRYPLGRYQVGDMIQYTNRGVGLVGFTDRRLGRLRPHVRFNCRPEITVLTLVSPPAGG